MDTDYHHTVLKTATPFGDFTKRCEAGQTFGVSELSTKEVQEARRATLQAFIQAYFGSVNAFAQALGRKQPQISETLKGTRSFGEKLARSLEADVEAFRATAAGRNLPPLQFDSPVEHSARLLQLIEYFEAIPTEQSQNELIELARIKGIKSGEEAATTQVERDFPVRGLGSLQRAGKAAPKKHRRA